MILQRRPHRLALVAALTVSLTAGPAWAAEWVAETSATLRGEYNDNIRLASTAHDSVWGTILDPRVKLSRRSELWDINAAGRIRAARYTGQDGLNTVDNFLDITAKRSMERGSFDASASLINDTTLQNETLDFDTGLTVNQIDRMQRNARLAYQYNFTEATWAEASASYTTVNYDHGDIYGLQDYTYLTPGLRIAYQYDAQTQIFGILNHSKVDYDLPSPLKSESKTDSLQFGASYDLTERWKVSGSVGTRRTKSSQVVIRTIPLPFPFPPLRYLETLDEQNSGMVYQGTLSRQFETGSLSLDASRSVTPSSTGAASDTTTVTINGTHQFSAKLLGEMAVSFYQSSTVGETTTANADYDRYRLTPNLTWKLDRDLTLKTGYTYTRIKRTTGTGNTVDSNAVYVSLGYYWPRMSVSR